MGYGTGDVRRVNCVLCMIVIELISTFIFHNIAVRVMLHQQLVKDICRLFSLPHFSLLPQSIW